MSLAKSQLESIEVMSCLKQNHFEFNSFIYTLLLYFILTNFSSGNLSACSRHWPSLTRGLSQARARGGLTNQWERGRPACWRSLSLSQPRAEELRSGHGPQPSTGPALCHLQTTETCNIDHRPGHCVTQGVTSHDDDDGPGVRRSVTDCPPGRPLSLQLSAAEITCAPELSALQHCHCSHSNCSQMEYLLPAPDTQSLMYEENSFIQSHIFVIASILSPKTEVKEVFSFFQCAYFGQSTRYIPADKSGSTALLMSLWEWHVKEVMSLYFVSWAQRY